MIKQSESRNRVRRPIPYWQPVSVGSTDPIWVTRPSVCPSLYPFLSAFLAHHVRSFVHSFPPFDLGSTLLLRKSRNCDSRGRNFPIQINRIHRRSMTAHLRTHTPHGRFHLAVFRGTSRSESSMSLTGRRPMTQEMVLQEVVDE